MLLHIALAAAAFVQPGRLPARAQHAATITCSAAAAEQTLVASAMAAGQVGLDASKEAQQSVQAAAQALTADCGPAPAEVPLSGTYELLHCMSKGGSSGKVGPFVGRVTQQIVDEKTFINQCELGPLKFALTAERKILDAKRIQVSFVETVISVFGVEVTRKPTKGKGVWEQLYVAAGDDGSARLRVMNTPSLFVLRQV